VNSNKESMKLGMEFPAFLFSLFEFFSKSSVTFSGFASEVGKMKITFQPMLAEPTTMVVLSFFFIGLLFFFTILIGIIALIVWLVKRQNKKSSVPEKPNHEKTTPIKSSPPTVPPTEIIRSSCPQCGTPLSSGTLAGLCPACLLKMGAATDTVTDAKQPPFVPPATAELAAKFPQLEILELIGQGGMGAVYKARQKQLDRIVALKILPPGIGDDPAFAERFTREAKALAKLNHPNIVTLFEFGRADLPVSPNIEAAQQRRPTAPLYYFLMEFVDGVNLRQLLQNRPVSTREALAIVPQICDALQFAHDQGIVHRDIKPENILLDRRGRVKVADFGLAKIIESKSGRADLPVSPNIEAAQQHRPTGVMGTPNYMSPEQKENPGDVDHRADIYALGVVFYQMLTGELPGKRLEPPSKKVQIDVRLDEIVLRALEKKPELRYQQASVLKTQLETVAADDLNPEAEIQKVEVKPCFSRTAIMGACWVALFLIMIGSWLFDASISAAVAAPNRADQSAVLIFVRLLPVLLGLTAIPGATILGWIAVSQIRRSAGKIYGMGLAIFDGLVFPLLALDFLIWYLCIISTMAFRNGSHTLERIPFAAGALIVSIIISALVDWFIIAIVWRTANKPVVPPVQKNDRFWRWFAVAVFAMIAIPFLISIVGLLAAIAIPNFVKGRQMAQANRQHQSSNYGFSYGNEQAARAALAPARLRQLANAPFIAQLPEGGSIELFAVRIGSSTNEPWWQPDGAPSTYESSITGEVVSDGITALVRTKFPLRHQLQPGQKMTPAVDLGNWPCFAAKDGRRIEPPESDAETNTWGVFGVMSFEQAIPTADETTLYVKVAAGDWKTMVVQKPGWLPSLFLDAARKEWKFSETATGVLKATVDHLLADPDTEYHFVGVDIDGKEYAPSLVQTIHTAGNIYSKYEIVFDHIGLTDALLFKNFREIRLESRPYQNVEFRNVSLRAGHRTTVEVKDFGDPLDRNSPNFSIGQTYFPKGDSIEITSVERTENQMTVKGHYNLVSADEASLWLNITATNNDEVPNQTEPPQSLHISKGAGDFELSRPQLVPGLPHVSMYDNHHAFAGIYFGTKDEALAESKLNLSETNQTAQPLSYQWYFNPSNKDLIEATNVISPEN
jgi:serine/threonine protein kinase/type II secretory pathway pseudopilin PulG